MPNDRNRTSVLRQLAALQKMKLPELQDKWRDLYGTEPPGYGPIFMYKRLAYRIQELYYGGLPEHVTKRIRKVAEAKKPGKSDDKILPGTRFVRYWNENRYEVIARKDGFEYAGRLFSSLSAVATEITGVRWNGPLFFGLRGGNVENSKTIQK